MTSRLRLRLEDSNLYPGEILVFGSGKSLCKAAAARTRTVDMNVEPMA